MIYCYLSDSALLPFDMDELPSGNLTYGKITGKGVGVGQVTERVLSMFNTDGVVSFNTDKSPGLLIDPRKSRLQNLFVGENVSSTLRCFGTMGLHYDTYWMDEDSKEYPSNDIRNVEKKELECLFNVIETCILSHVFDNSNNAWRYLTKSELDGNAGALANYSSDANGSYGFVKGTLVMPAANSYDKQANIKFVSSTSNIPSLIIQEPINFAPYIEFSFKFSNYESATGFVIYTDPETLVNRYARTRITNIIFPADPEKLLQLNFTSINEVISSTSSYVGDVIANKVFKSSENGGILAATNHSGAIAFSTEYAYSTDNKINLTFTCLFKGRIPTQNELRAALLQFLDNAYPAEEEIIPDVFPNLISTEYYLIIPLYDTRKLNQTYSNLTVSENIVSLKYMNKISETFSPDHICSSIITIPGYYMYGVVCPADVSTHNNNTTEEDISNIKYTEHGLDVSNFFDSYLPLSTSDYSWKNMSDNARALNEALAKIVAGELQGHSAAGINYVKEIKQVNGRNYYFYTFVIGYASFSVMTYDSYTQLVGVLT